MRFYLCRLKNNFLIISIGMTLKPSNKINANSLGKSPYVLNKLPPKYIKYICAKNIPPIITKNTLFFNIPENILTLVVLALKALKILKKINSEKKAVI